MKRSKDLLADMKSKKISAVAHVNTEQRLHAQPVNQARIEIELMCQILDEDCIPSTKSKPMKAYMVKLK
jgi:hypothetical protein